MEFQCACFAKGEKEKGLARITVESVQSVQGLPA